MPHDIEDIVSAMPALGGVRSVQPLLGGITNHSYRVAVGDNLFVLRVAGENTTELGIDRGRELACATIAAAAGVGAEVVDYLPQKRALLSRFVEGHVLTSDDVAHYGVLARAASAIARLHAAPAFPGAFCPFAVVVDYFQLAKSHDVPLPSQLHEVFEHLDDLRNEVAHSEAPSPCHNDLLPANLIDDGTSIRIIDWEYAGMGDRFFDLGNFAENHCLTAQQEVAFLRFYSGAADSQDLRRLRAMRRVSLLREAMWGFVQAGISHLDFNFLDYGNKHLERFLQAARP